jgi:hypothetical protein
MVDIPTVNISVKRVTRFFLFTVIGLTLAGMAGQFSKYFLGRDKLYGLVPLFDLNAEANVPAWYSSMTLLISSFLLAVIAYHKKEEDDRYFRHWLGLSLIFALLSIDEISSIHELLSQLRHTSTLQSSIFHFAWVIPFGILVIGLFFTYLQFIFHLPPRIRNLVIISGAVYVGAALGMEIYEGYWVSVYGEESVYKTLSTPAKIFTALTIAEECLEMVGIVIFIHALLSYISDFLKEVKFKITYE